MTAVGGISKTQESIGISSSGGEINLSGGNITASGNTSAIFTPGTITATGARINGSENDNATILTTAHIDSV